MTYIIQLSVFSFMFLIFIVLKKFYKFEDRSNEIDSGATILTGLSFLLVYMVSFVIYEMTFDTSTYGFYAKSNLSYMIMGLIILIKITLILSLLFQTTSLKRKYKLKIEEI